MSEQDISRTAVFLFILVEPGQDERNANVFLMPTPDGSVEQEIRNLISDEWVREAPAGMYAFQFDSSQKRTSDGLRKVSISAPGPRAIAHARRLDEEFASKIVSAGVQLGRIIELLPGREELEQRFDGAFIEAVGRVCERGEVQQIVPDCVPFLLVTEQDREQASELVMQAGAIASISLTLPNEDFVFHSHVRGMLQEVVDDIVPKREMLIVRERVRALRRARRVLTGQRRKSVDAQIDHLCTAFGIEEDTITSLGWATSAHEA